VRLLEEVVCHNPFVSILVAPQLSTGHEEGTPSVEPHDLSARWVCLPQKIHDFSRVLIHILQPPFCCQLVVLAVHVPMLLQFQVALEVEEQISRRHGPSGEKVTRHPVCLGLCHKVVGKACVDEDVNKQLPPGQRTSETRPRRTS